MSPELRYSLPAEALQAFLDARIRSAQQTAHPGSLPLLIAQQRCGWVAPAAVRALTGHAGVVVTAEALNIGQDLSGDDQDLSRLDVSDEQLSALAQTLHSAGCAPGWRNELLDIWPVSDQQTDDSVALKPIGRIERGVMRALGLLTQAVHLSAWSASGELWVARRSLNKATDPGMWDTLVGGLVGSAEPPELALEREADEEAGLDAPDIVHRSRLRRITRMHRRLPEGFQVEDVLTCECVLPDHLTPANRDGEVMEIKRLAPAVVWQMLQDGAFTLEASIVITEDLLRTCASPR